jgi:hypothetical protein
MQKYSDNVVPCLLPEFVRRIDMRATPEIGPRSWRALTLNPVALCLAPTYTRKLAAWAGIGKFDRLHRARLGRPAPYHGFARRHQKAHAMQWKQRTRLAWLLQGRCIWSYRTSFKLFAQRIRGLRSPFYDRSKSEKCEMAQ